MQKFILSKAEGLISISEAAEFLDVSIDTLRRYDKLGILHSTRPGGKIRYFNLEELKKVKLSKPLMKATNPQPTSTPPHFLHKKTFKAGLFLVRVHCLIAVTILTILFLLFPEQTAHLLTSFM